MPSWTELLKEVQDASRILDLTRKKYIRSLADLTGRNVIVYYSGWLQKTQPGASSAYSINDSDKNAFMAVIHQLDRTKGLDLLLHTPGGDLAATESIVDYLHSMFGNNIRAIVPQLAMSAGTMIALACSQVVLGKHSSLGPIDPQIGGLPAHDIVQEFYEARQDIINNPDAARVWQPIISRYSPTLLRQCIKAIAWSQEMVKQWLIDGMFSGLPDAENKADRVLRALGDPAISKSHSRHISQDSATRIGLKVVRLERNQKLQEAVLTVHHACTLTLAQTSVSKLIENDRGTSHVSHVELARI